MADEGARGTESPAHQDERDPLELAAAEFTEKLRRGEKPSAEEHIARHPELAEEIRELFPTIEAMERLKLHKERSSDGRASLGAAKLERLGDFRIVREIGRGGMGIVYEAEQESLGRHVAIKVLPKQALLDPKHLKRFQQEARIAAGLHHTNIAEVFGVGEADGFHYYVMQLVHGVGLDKVLVWLAGVPADTSGETHGPARPAAGEDAAESAAIAQRLLGEASRPGAAGGSPQYWRSVANIGQQTAGALQYAHTQGTLHRDIKPANLLVDATGVAWVTDFGLAKAIQSESVTMTGDITGTLRYMAPEQFAGMSDARSDIYSLGLTLYEFLTLRPAFSAPSRDALITQVAQREPVRPRKLNPHIPMDLETIVLKAIAREPMQRYQSAGELAADLQRFIDDRPIEARQVSSAERLRRWCRRNPAVASLTGATVCLTVLVAVVATVGYVRTRRALEGEAQERQKAEASAELAIETLDRLFERFSPSRTVTMSELAVEGVEGGKIEVPNPVVLSKESAALLEDMLAFYDRLSKQSGDEARLRRKVADANRRVGDIRRRLGQHDQAIAAYQRAIEGFSGLKGYAGAGTEIARIYNELGQLNLSVRQVTEARQAHLKALATLESDSSALAADAKYQVARAHYFLGSGAPPTPGFEPSRPARTRPAPERPPPQGRAPPPRPDGPLFDGPPPPPRPGDGGFRPEDAREIPKEAQPRQPEPKKFQSLAEGGDHLQKAIALLEELAKAYPSNPNYRHLLALSYRERHDELAAGQAAAAERAFDKALEALRSLVRDFPDVPDYRYDLCETYAAVEVRGPLPPGDDSRVTEQRLCKALELSEKLVAQQPYVPQYLFSLAHVQHKLGTWMLRTGRFEEGGKYLRKAVDLQFSLASQFPQVPDYEIWLGALRNSLAETMLRRGQLREPRALLEDSIVRLKALLKKSPDLWVVHGLLAHSQTLLATVLRDADEPKLAADALREAEQHRQVVRSRPRDASQWGNR